MEDYKIKSGLTLKFFSTLKLVTLYVKGHQILATLIYSVAQQPTRPFFLHFFFCWWSKTLHHYHHLCVSSQWCMTHWRDWRAITVMGFDHFLSGALPPCASFWLRCSSEQSYNPLCWIHTLVQNLIFDKRQWKETYKTIKIGSDWIILDQMTWGLLEHDMGMTWRWLEDDLMMTWGWLEDDLGISCSTLDTLAACYILI